MTPGITASHYQLSVQFPFFFSQKYQMSYPKILHCLFNTKASFTTLFKPCFNLWMRCNIVILGELCKQLFLQKKGQGNYFCTKVCTTWRSWMEEQRQASGDVMFILLIITLVCTVLPVVNEQKYERFVVGCAHPFRKRILLQIWEYLHAVIT